MSEIHRIVRATAFGQSMGPELLTEVQRTFDAAWPKVANRFTAGKTDGGRTELAKILLQLFADKQIDRSTIADVAIRLLHEQEDAGDADLGRHNGSGSGGRVSGRAAEGRDVRYHLPPPLKPV